MAENSNSKRLNFKISWEEHAPTSPRRLATSALESMPKPLESMLPICPPACPQPFRKF